MFLDPLYAKPLVVIIEPSRGTLDVRIGATPEKLMSLFYTKNRLSAIDNIDFIFLPCVFFVSLNVKCRINREGVSADLSFEMNSIQTSSN